MSEFFERVYAVVRRIPRGRVMTYGQIGRWLGAPHAARTVGWAMRAAGPQNVPWHRVINSRGRISAPHDVERLLRQKALLEAEGVRFDSTGACDLDRYRWEPEDDSGPESASAIE